MFIASEKFLNVKMVRSSAHPGKFLKLFSHCMLCRQTRKLRDAEDYSDRALLKNMLKLVPSPYCDTVLPVIRLLVFLILSDKFFTFAGSVFQNGCFLNVSL